MSPKLIPITYHKRNYPCGIDPEIQEIAGHLDIDSIAPITDYSLHTEYSYTKRKLNSPLLSSLQSLKASDRNGVPRLWFNQEWAVQFFEFIKLLARGYSPPKIIEIHPPFDDYCPSISDFLAVYSLFEDRVKSLFPETVVLLENRYGTTYRGGAFIVCKPEHILELAEAILAKDLKLRITLDLPQFLSACGGAALSVGEIRDFISLLNKCKRCIAGIHLWGKKKNNRGRVISHIGDLYTLFDHDNRKKKAFLSALHDLLDDNNPRFFVPEVNSNDRDLECIVNDLRESGFIFVTRNS